MMTTMKNIFISSKLTWLILILMVFHSCSNFLEQEPGSQTSINQIFSTKEGALLALNGNYSSIEALVRGERFSVYADLQGGNLKFTPTATGSNTGQITIPINLANVYSFQDDAIDSDFTSFYDGCYSVINQANLIIEFVDSISDATEVEKSQIKAEALVIRAYTHYLLVLVYAQNYSFTPNASHLGVVYNKITLTEGITFPSRQTVLDTYNLITEDLISALNQFSSVSLLSGPVYSHFNSINTKALLARIYLSKNDWPNALSMANEVISSSGITLISQESYIGEWEAENTPISEILLEFSVPRDDGGSVGGSLAQQFGYVSRTNYGRYVASNDLIELYEPADIRRLLFLEQSLPTLVDGDLEDVTYYFTKKFQNNPGYPALRLSEMYLIAAEASFELGQTDSATEFINAIRSRANASLLENSGNLETDILLERRKEMAFEGQYFFDLSRRQGDVVRNDGCISTVCNLNYPSPRFILPIPLKNINLNSNLEQNDSY